MTRKRQPIRKIIIFIGLLLLSLAFTQTIPHEAFTATKTINSLADWTGVSSFYSDPAGDAGSGQGQPDDLIGMGIINDSGNLYVRWDVIQGSSNLTGHYQIAFAPRNGDATNASTNLKFDVYLVKGVVNTITVYYLNTGNTGVSAILPNPTNYASVDNVSNTAGSVANIMLKIPFTTIQGLSNIAESAKLYSNSARYVWGGTPSNSLNLTAGFKDVIPNGGGTSSKNILDYDAGTGTSTPIMTSEPLIMISAVANNPIVLSNSTVDYTLKIINLGADTTISTTTWNTGYTDTGASSSYFQYSSMGANGNISGTITASGSSCTLNTPISLPKNVEKTLNIIYNVSNAVAGNYYSRITASVGSTTYDSGLTALTTVKTNAGSKPTISGSSSTLNSVSFYWPVVSGALSYNIYLDGVKIGNTTGLNYTITNLMSAATYGITVTSVTSTGESVSSDIAFIKTASLSAATPIISSGPSSVTKNIGEAATFTTTANTSDSGTLSYQWQKYNGSVWTDIIGARSSSYSTGALNLTDNGSRYRCVVTNTLNGTTADATTGVALITLNLSNQCDVISVTSPEGTLLSGTDISASVDNSCSELTVSLVTSNYATWKLFADAACTQEFTSKTLNLVEGLNTAYIKVTAQNGTSYKNYTLKVTRASAPEEVATAVTPSVSGPGSVTKNVGDTAILTVEASSSDHGDLTYQWQRYNGAAWENIEGEINASYTTGILSAEDNGVRYRCVVTNAKNATTATSVSDEAVITMNPENAQDVPTFSVPSGSITFGTGVTIISANADHIFYTTDGSDPLNYVDGSTYEYAEPIVVDRTMTIKAIAVKANKLDSSIASVSYSQRASADLTSLEISGSPTNFSFAGDQYDYNDVKVAYNVSGVTLTPVGDGRITVNGIELSSGQLSDNIELEPGVENTVTVICTQPGNSPKTYTIKITRTQLASNILNDAALLNVMNAEGDSYDQVTSSVTLPIQGQSGTTSISWSSSDPEIISNTGVVKRPEPDQENATVTLRATITDTITGASTAKTFAITVLKLSNEEAVIDAARNLTIAKAFHFEPGDTWEAITRQFIAITGGDHGTTIDWISDSDEIELVNGTHGVDAIVTRPSDSNKNVILSAKISLGTKNVTKTFLLVVQKEGVEKSVTREVTQRSATAETNSGDISQSIAIERSKLQDNTFIDYVKLEETQIEALASSISSSDSTNGNASVTVSVTGDTEQKAQQIAIEIPTLSVSALADKNSNLNIKTDEGSIRLNQDVLNSMANQGLDLFFRIVPINDSNGKTKANNTLMNNSLVTSYVGGNQLSILGIPRMIETNYSNYDTYVTLPLTGAVIPTTGKDEFLDSLRIFIEHSDGSIELVKPTRIIYDNDIPVGVEFKISKFSQFQLISYTGQSGNEEGNGGTPTGGSSGTPTNDSSSGTPENDSSDVGNNSSNDGSGAGSGDNTSENSKDSSKPVDTKAGKFVQKPVIKQGTVIGTTSLTVNASSKNKIAIYISKKSIVIPNLGDNAPTGSKVINPYISGTDISGVDYKKYRYLGVYELDKNNRILKFEQIILNEGDIKQGSKVLILATSRDYSDYHAGFILNGIMGGRLLRTGISADEINKTVDYIIKNIDRSGKIYILGGTSAIPEIIITKLKEQGFRNFIRIGGKDKYETAALIADYSNAKKGTPVILTSGETEFSQLYDVSKISGNNSFPILYFMKNTLTDSTKKALLKLRPTKIYLAGNDKDINNAVLKDLISLLKIKPTDIVWVKTKGDLKKLR